MSDDLNSKCRTCLSESNTYHQLFGYVEKKYKIVEMLDGIVPQIDAKITSQFSTLVCQICVDKLLISYKFQQLCIETNNRLHDLLGISVLGTETKLEKILDPSKEECNITIKKEIEDDCFNYEAPHNELVEEMVSYNNIGSVPDSESGTDSSNEKLSVLKERSAKKNSFKTANFEKTNKQNRVKGNFETQGFLYKNESNDTARTQLECQDSKEPISFQCPECPKYFEKKTSFSAHYKVHNKKEKNYKTKKCFEQCLQDIEIDPSSKLEERPHDIAEKISELVVKEETEITSQIFGASVDWFNNDEDSDDNSESHKVGSEANESENIDFIDTGIGEVEKPNSINERNCSFPCEVCGKIFDRPYLLKRHSSVHSLTRPHECEICKYRFATANILKAHLFQHKNETGGNFYARSRPDGFKCPDCPRRFEKQASLSAHRQIHGRNTSEAIYPCMVCQRNFMSTISLTEHITCRHPEVEKHKCDQCDKTFVLHAHLVEHLNRHKGNRNLVCVICEKEFRYNNTLKEHMRLHSGECPYLCPQCGKTFRTASNLHHHIERHTGLKKYQCPECPSRFNCRSDLMKHAQTHLTIKPHVCDICGSRFTRAYSMQKHKLLHSGERPFKCDQCNMTFVIIHHLRRHMRTHTGEKPHKCKYCERAYAESADLTKHLRTHVGENTYMCDQCPMAFKYQAELKKHRSQHYKKLLQQTQRIPEVQYEITEQTQPKAHNLHQQQQQFSIQEQQKHNKASSKI